MEKLPQRKTLRLKQYDYSSKGAYFITVCLQERKPLLSDIIRSQTDDCYNVHLTSIGKIIEQTLLSSEKIPGVKIDKYVIMPDHIHAIIVLDPAAGITKSHKNESCLICGTSKAPSPTINKLLPHIISTFKRFCNKKIGLSIFQRGYVEHIIRDKDDYDVRVKYMHDNPLKWYYEKMKML